MKLYFLRHGYAGVRDDADPADDFRELTPEGAEEAKAVVARLKEVGVAVDVVVTSPLPRAKKTAEFAAAALDAPLVEEEGLGDDETGDAALEVIRRYAGAEALMIVGHEPYLSNAIRRICGAELKLKKSGVAYLKIDDAKVPTGRLKWVAAPKMFL